MKKHLILLLLERFQHLHPIEKQKWKRRLIWGGVGVLALGVLMMVLVVTLVVSLLPSGETMARFGSKLADLPKLAAPQPSLNPQSSPNPSVAESRDLSPNSPSSGGLQESTSTNTEPHAGVGSTAAQGVPACVQDFFARASISGWGDVTEAIKTCPQLDSLLGAQKQRLQQVCEAAPVTCAGALAMIKTQVLSQWQLPEVPQGILQEWWNLGVRSLQSIWALFFGAPASESGKSQPTSEWH